MALLRVRLIWNTIFAGLFIFSLTCFLLSIINYFVPKHINAEKPESARYDEYYPSLMRLNTIEKMEAYCDSIYMANASTMSYPEVVSAVVRKRFYHGYSYYNKFTNPMASFFSLGVGKGATAIVLPEDIIKFPFGACSQQSIVGMELVKRKGYNVRKVTMYDDITKQGHFTYEANYDNSWHFFDTDMEPDAKVLAQYNRPSVAYLKQHPEVTALAYHGKNPLLFERLVSSAIVGPSNEQTAPVATKFQSATKFLNYFSWLFGAMFILIRRRILVRKSKAFTWFKRKSTQFQPINASMQSREARA